MGKVSITTKMVMINGKKRYHFVVNGKSKSLRTWSSAAQAKKAGRREFGLS